MSLFLVLGPVIFAGVLFTNQLRDSIREQARTFLLGLAAGLGAALLQYMTHTWFPVPYGSVWGFFSFWHRDFFWFSAAAALPLALVPSLRDRSADRKARFLSFTLGAFSLSGLLTCLYLGPPRDVYFIIYLPLLRIALAAILAYALDRTISEYGGVLALWIALSVLAGPLIALVPVFHFWNMAYLSLPLLGAACGLGYLALFGWGSPRRIIA
jgi:hypothetical protein